VVWRKTMNGDPRYGLDRIFGSTGPSVLSVVIDAFSTEARDLALLDREGGSSVTLSDDAISQNINAEIDSLYLDLPGRFRAQYAATAWKRVVTLLSPNGSDLILRWAREASSQALAPDSPLLLATESLYDLNQQRSSDAVS
jgi:hypothetical protein